MYKNYFYIAFRNLIKYRFHTVVNVLGLSVGIAITILILILVREELSYDRYNKDWKRIYRVNQHARVNDNEYKVPLTPIALRKAILDEIPEAEEVTRLLRGSHKLVSYENTQFSAERFFYADESFFRVFSIPLLRGDRDHVLADEKTLVITRSTAKRYFGEDDPIGKVLKLDNGWEFSITGICEDVPENSHFQFDYLASLRGILDDYREDAWLMDMMSTYILARDDKNKNEITTHLNRFMREYVLPRVDQVMGQTSHNFNNRDEHGYHLQPLADIHLNTLDEGEFEAGTDRMYIYLFTIIALLILFIACINYINLSTSRSIARAREIAIRKMTGASRWQMISQFLAESVIFSFIALFISLVVLELLIRPFNLYSGKNLEIHYFENWYLLPSLILGAFLIGVVSGLYPAFYLTSVRVVNILKGRYFGGMRSIKMRGMLVVIQFTISIILLVSSMIIYQQVKYLRNKNLGFNQDNIVVVQRAYALQNRKEEFKSVLLKHPKINAASVSMVLPGTSIEPFPFHIEGSGENRLIYLRPMPADIDFLSTMQMYLVEGDHYARDDSTCYSSVLINETAAKKLDVKNPAGMKLMGYGMEGEEIEFTVIGIVQDYHFESLHREIKPLAITLLDEKDHAQYLSVRISGEDMTGTVEYIRAMWREYANVEPFDFYFLSQELGEMYSQEQTTASIFTIFFFLSLFIAVLGLFGLASFTTEQKTREIGIRKAMGASMSRIMLMLSAQFTKWILWANLLAIPIALAGMKLWLGKFAYHINIDPWLFFITALLILVVALLTVSYQSYHTARENPVAALQYE